MFIKMSSIAIDPGVILLCLVLVDSSFGNPDADPGQELCSDLTLPPEVLFDRKLMQKIDSSEGILRKDFDTVDECLTTCLQMEGCYGVDWKAKTRNAKTNRCWLHDGDVGNLTQSNSVNHYRRLPCPDETGRSGPKVDSPAGRVDIPAGRVDIPAGQESCLNLTLPPELLFEYNPMQEMDSSVSILRKDFDTVDECLTICLQLEDCYGVDWRAKTRNVKNHRCWLHEGDVGNLKINPAVNHYRRLPCPGPREDTEGSELGVTTTEGAEFCTDLTLPPEELFESNPMQEMASKGTLLTHFETVDECLTTCLQINTCRGVDWKKREGHKNRCWIHEEDSGNLKNNLFVSNYRRLSCRELHEMTEGPDATTTEVIDVDATTTETERAGIATEVGAATTKASAEAISTEGLPDNYLGWPVIEREFSDVKEWTGSFIPDLFPYKGSLEEISYYWGGEINEENMHEEGNGPKQEVQALFQSIGLTYAARNLQMGFGLWRRTTINDVAGFEVILFSAGQFEPGVNTVAMTPSLVQPGFGLVLLSSINSGKGTFNYDNGSPATCGTTYSGDFRQASATEANTLFIPMDGIEIRDPCIIPSIRMKVVPIE